MACRDLSQTVLQRSTSFLQAISSPKILISSDMKNCEKTTPVGNCSVWTTIISIIWTTNKLGCLFPANKTNLLSAE